jgi:hypothetical protein
MVFLLLLLIDKEFKTLYNNENKKGATTMAAYNTMFHMSMLQQRVEVTVHSPGLYCRTQISE